MRDELPDDFDDGSIIINPEGSFQSELQKVIVTKQSLDQLRTLRQMLQDSLCATRLKGSSLVDDAISVAFLQGQLVVVDILLNSKRILPAEYGE